MKMIQKILSALLLAVTLLHGADNELLPLKRNYSDAQLKKLDEATEALEKLGQLSWDLHCLRSGTRPYNKDKIRIKKTEINKEWIQVKKVVERVVVHDSIHPDDIGIPRKKCDRNGRPLLRRRLLWYCTNDEDIDFTRFLIMHGADPNDPQLKLLSNVSSLPIAITSIIYGAHVASFKNYHKGTLLHELRTGHKNATDLTLLYYLHGVDPTILDKFGKTPLIDLARDVAEGGMFDSRWNNTERNTRRCFMLASNLIKIGVPLDAQLIKTYLSFFSSTAHPSDTAMAIVDRAYADSSKDTEWDPNYYNRITLFKKTLLDAQAEVDEAKKKHAAELAQTLEQLINSCGVRALITDYAQEHIVPDSIKPDLERIYKQDRALREKFDKQELGGIGLSCVVS